LPAIADFGAHVDIVRCAVAVDDLEVVHVDGVARHLEADGLELAFAPADLDRVAVDEESHFLATELLPMVGAAVAVAALCERRLGGKSGEG
jgi:hypothetical protein